MIKRLLKKVFYFFVKLRGYSNAAQINELIACLKRDFKYRKIIGYLDIYKAYSKGFSGMFYYKLKEAKIPLSSCLPDLEYFKMHPINKSFSHWIDDKLSIKYILGKYDTFLPCYYGFIKNGCFTRLMDFPSSYSFDLNGLLELLRDKAELAIKKNAGSLSMGFYKLKYHNGSYFINDESTPEKDMILFFQTLDDYLVTEYVHAHPFLTRINQYAPNIIRLLLINQDGCNPVIIASYLRIGQRSTGYTELTPSGGIFCGIDIGTGELFDPKTFDGPNVYNTPLHPDTNIPIEGNIPNWKYVVENICDIAKYLPNLKYMGLDIIITETSFKIIEINSLSGVSYIQMFYPLLDNPAGKRFFKGYTN